LKLKSEYVLPVNNSGTHRLLFMAAPDDVSLASKLLYVALGVHHFSSSSCLPDQLAVGRRGQSGQYGQ
jgi:hypothetical protein